MKIRINFINEGQIEDLVQKYPDRLKTVYDQGLLSNIKPAFVLWLAKQDEPVEDIIGLLSEFERNKGRLEKKDINQYTSDELRSTLEELGTSKSSQLKQLKSSDEDEILAETTILGNWGNWIIVMPHTAKSSVYWGKGTTWCTSANSTSNLFLNYVARKSENIILFYLINKGSNVESDKFAKMSVGFRNNSPIFGENGGLSVNAENKGIEPNVLRKKLGEYYDVMMDAMILFSTKLAGLHPSKQQMIKLSQDFKLLKNYLTHMESGSARKDFVKQILDFNSTPKIKFELLKMDKPDILCALLSKIRINEDDYYNNEDIFSSQPYLNNSFIAESAIEKLFYNANETKEYSYVEDVISSSYSQELLLMLEPHIFEIKDKVILFKLLLLYFAYSNNFDKLLDFTKKFILYNKNDHVSMLKLFNMIDNFILYKEIPNEYISELEKLWITKNKMDPKFIISDKKINENQGQEFVKSILKKTNNEKFIIKYSKNFNFYPFIAENKNTPENILIQIFKYLKLQNNSFNEMRSLITNENFPFSLVKEYIKSLNSEYENYEKQQCINAAILRMKNSKIAQENIDFLKYLLNSEKNKFTYIINADTMPPVILKMLVFDPNSNVRGAFLNAMWRKIPKAALITLLRDSDPEINQKALKYLENKKDDFPDLYEKVKTGLFESKKIKRLKFI